MKTKTALALALLFLITGCAIPRSSVTITAQPSGTPYPTQVEITAIPPTVTPEPELSPKEISHYIPQGEVYGELIELDMLEEDMHQRIVQAMRDIGLEMGDVSVQAIKLSDETEREWHNILVSKPSEEEKGTNRQSWLYAEINKSHDLYVMTGEGTGGELIPIKPLYVVGEEKVEAGQLEEGQWPRTVIFRLGNEEDENFQRVREFISFDLQEGEVYYTDPWTGERYQLEKEVDRGLLASLVPIEQQLFPGLPFDSVREILSQGWLPERDGDGSWIVLNRKKEIVRIWDKEEGAWSEPEVKVTLEAKNNIEKWLNGEGSDYTEEELFRNPEDMDERYPIGYYTFSELSLDEKDFHERKTRVQLQGVALGFGEQEVSMDYEGVELKFKQRMIFLGLNNRQTKKRIVVPFTYNFIGPYGLEGEKEKFNYVFSEDTFPIYWHVSSAPIWGSSVLRTEAYDVEEIPERLSHMIGKPISVDYWVEVWPEGVTMKEIAASQGVDLSQIPEEKAERAEVFVATEKEFLHDDYGLLKWMRGKSGGVPFIEEEIDLDREQKVVMVGRLFAPEKEE